MALLHVRFHACLKLWDIPHLQTSFKSVVSNQLGGGGGNSNYVLFSTPKPWGNSLQFDLPVIFFPDLGGEKHKPPTP